MLLWSRIFFCFICILTSSVLIIFRISYIVYSSEKDLGTGIVTNSLLFVKSKWCLYCSCTHFLCSLWYFPFPCWTYIPGWLQCYQTLILWFFYIHSPFMLYCCNFCCGFFSSFLGQILQLCLLLFHHSLFCCHLYCSAWWFLSCRHNVYYVVWCVCLVELLFSIC